MDDTHNNFKSLGDIYRLIYQNPNCSRQDIANLLNISLPTLAQKLKALTELNLIYNAGVSESTGGRKATIWKCTPDARYAIGLDITRNHLSIVMIDMAIHLIANKRLRLPFSETDEYFSTIKDEISEMIALYIDTPDKLLGVGVSMPVIIGSDQMSITYASVIDISANIYEKLAHYIDYPYLLFNDANCAGLAESWGHREPQPMVYLSLSSSVGGANMNDHNIYTGSNSKSSEFGHMKIVPNGKKCYCGQYGCLDSYCASNVLTDFTSGDIRKFFSELKTGKNKGFQNIFNEYMDYLAIAVNNLRMCYDCDVVLGGTVGAFMADYIDIFRQKAIALNPFESDPSYIRVCHYRTEASAVGSAIYYIDEFIQNFK